MREGADAFGGFGRLSSFHTLGSQQHLFAFQLKSFSHPRQGCPDGSVPIGCWRQDEESKARGAFEPAWTGPGHAFRLDNGTIHANHLQLFNARTPHRIEPSKPPKTCRCPLTTSPEPGNQRLPAYVVSSFGRLGARASILCCCFKKP